MDGKPLRLASGTKGSPANSFDGLIFGELLDVWLIYGGFLKQGYPKSSINRWIFDNKNHPAFWGTTMTMETPISKHFFL